MRKLLLLLLLSGCASDPYWVKTHEPVLIRGIIYVDYPGGTLARGYANYEKGLIEIRRGLPEAQRWCAEMHERKHFAGYSHPAANGRPHFAADCGNGERL